MKRTLVLIAAVIFISGCAKAPIQLNKFDPTALSAHMTTFAKDDIAFARFDNGKYDCSAALLEYQNIFVAELEITNNSISDIGTREYCVGLFDGRDFKPVKMLSEEKLRDIKAKLGGSSTVSFDSTEKMVQSAINSLIAAVNPSSDKSAADALEILLNDYFAFRPVFAGETRKGMVAFALDFRLEHPLTVEIVIKGEKIDFRFTPANKPQKQEG